MALGEEVYHQGKALRVQRLTSLLVHFLFFAPVAQDVRVLGPCLLIAASSLTSWTLAFWND